MNLTEEQFAQLYRRANVASHSLKASLLGYLAGALLLVAYSFALMRSAGNQRFVLLIAELILSLLFSIVGWMIYVLPITWLYHPGNWMDQIWLTAVLGGLLGVAIIAALFGRLWMVNDSQTRLAIDAYAASAFVNAALASALCILFCQRSEQRVQSALRKQMMQS